MDDRRLVLPGIIAGLLLSATAFALSPLLMPDSYSWVAHTLSQAGAQGQEGGWLSRVGFLFAGLTVLRLARFDVVDWMSIARIAHRLNGALLLAAVAFSDRSWDAGAPYDRVENIVHSAIATMIAISFTFGVLLVAYQKWFVHGRLPMLETIVVAVQMVMPPMMLVWVEGTGLIERVMFGTAFVWYGWEVLRCAGFVRAAHASRGSVEPEATRLLQFELRRMLHLPPADGIR